MIERGTIKYRACSKDAHKLTEFFVLFIRTDLHGFELYLERTPSFHDLFKEVEKNDEKRNNLGLLDIAILSTGMYCISALHKNF